MQTCIFFVVPGDGDALLGMPDIELLNILNVNCNTIGAEKGANCNANKVSIIDAGDEHCCANTGPESSCTKTNSNADCYINIGSN